MAPAVTETVGQVTQNLKQKLSLKDQVQPNLEAGHREPLKLKQFEVTPVIGKEFVDVDLAEWLRAPNSDELLRDLAITGTAIERFLSLFSSKRIV
jgi:GAF domain-containing protein